jgi:glycine hydroxymethyltransferase
MDLRPQGDLTGKAAEEALGAAGIHVNKNTVPGEPRSPFVTSGLRIGTPALTTRGMGAQEMRQVGRLIDEVLKAPDEATIERVHQSVRELAGAFPLYRPAASTA